ncbi:cupin domain-containing protein [Bradyrhizobium acaciae]|uniref:cupin domain-containing protein n=1 Tax=Bradyrhizobium acaciae TaxID=2683706 RepID=UPI001E2B9168|nr:cupin domain-containing protein [Bradyrhizobium acaciae]MCC8982542.1 cupin domain-containing protein [Bradyrhizobium acaciae]
MLRIVALTLLASAATAHAEIVRKELKRADVAGTDMEAIEVYLEVPPGESLPRHTHHGEEIVYVIQGATLLLPDGSQRELPTGIGVINQRGVPHAGFKIGGDKTLKLINVFVVDKGKPLTEIVK